MTESESLWDIEIKPLVIIAGLGVFGGAFLYCIAELLSVL